MARMIRTTLAALTALAALTLSACSDDEPQRDEEGNITESADAADVFAIQDGDCVGDFSDGEEISNIAVTPCEEEHAQQVFTTAELPDGDFPSEDAFQAQAEESCLTEFQTFVGLAYDDSELAYTWLQPTEESWEQGDHELVCLVYDPAGPVTGTLEGANR